MLTFKSGKYQIDIFENKIGSHNIYITDGFYTNSGIVYDIKYSQDDIIHYIQSHGYAPQIYGFDTNFGLTKTNLKKINAKLKKLGYQIF